MSRLQCLEQLELALVQSLFSSDAVIHLEMTGVRASMEESSVPDLRALDDAIRAKTPVLQTSSWERPVDMPFGTEAQQYESEPYCLAVCKSYVACLAQAVVARLGTLAEQDTPLFLEMQDHLALRNSMSEGAQAFPPLFQDTLVKQYIQLERPAPPLVLHAPAGGGRTIAAVQTLHIIEQLPTKSHTERVIVPRFAGLTTRASSLQSFLYDLNRHLCMVYDGDMRAQPTSEGDLVRRWANVLQLASPYLPVVIVVDVDQHALETSSGSPLPIVNWLPPMLPGSVRMVVLTNSVEVRTLRSRIPEGMFRALVHEPSRELCTRAIQSHLGLRSKTLTKDQLDGILEALPLPHVSPLLLAMLGMTGALWNHEQQAPLSVPGAELAVSAFVEALEKRHGVALVRNAVLTLCVCREGATDVEVAAMLKAVGGAL